MPVLYHGRNPASRVDRRLWDASHVFLRVDAVRRPLVPPYEGPFPVLERSEKTFIILKRDKPVTVTIDRLKPAVFLPETNVKDSGSVRPAAAAVGPRPRALPVLPAPAVTDVRLTSSGRVSRPPARFQA